MQTLADEIKDGRARRGLTQLELSIASGVGLTTIRDIEQGRVSDARWSTVERLRGVLDGGNAAAAHGGTEITAAGPTGG